MAVALLTALGNLSPITVAQTSRLYFGGPSGGHQVAALDINRALPRPVHPSEIASNCFAYNPAQQRPPKFIKLRRHS